MPTQTPKEIIAGLYAAVFNRAPDKAGLEFWAEQADGGDATEAYQNIMDPAGDATGFVNHPVFVAAYDTLTNAEFAAKIYENALGQAGDQEGINFWTTQLDLGMTRGDMVVDFVEGALTGEFTAENFPSLTADELTAARERQDYLSNKVEVAIHWVAELDDKTNVTDANDLTNDLAYIASQHVLEEVNQDENTVDHMNAIIDAASDDANSAQFIIDHVDGHTPSAEGITISATPIADNLVATEDNDTFVATQDTLGLGDVFDGKGGDDTLNISINGTTGVTLTGFETKDVETIAVKSLSSAASILDMSDAVGAKVIESNETDGNSLLFRDIQDATATISIVDTDENHFINYDAQTLSGVTDKVTLSVTEIRPETGAAVVDLDFTQDTGGDDAAIETLVVESKDISNNIKSISVGAALGTMDINGNANLTVVDALDAELNTVDAIDLDAQLTLNMSASTASTVTFNGAKKETSIDFGDASNTKTITTQTANDNITANAGNNTVTSGAGSDTIALGSGNDTVDAGEGNDSITTGTGADKIDGGEGDDDIYLTPGDLEVSDTIVGGEGIDTLHLSDGDNITESEAQRVSEVEIFDLNGSGTTLTVTDNLIKTATGDAGFTVDTASATGTHTIDMTNITSPEDKFTLKGSETVSEVVIADDATINSMSTLAFGAGANDTLRVVDGATITVSDLVNVTGLDNIVLESASNTAQTWDIDLDENMVITVSPTIPAGSILNIKASGAATVVVNSNANITVNIDSTGTGTVTKAIEYLFTDNADNLPGTAGDDVYTANSRDQVETADFANAGTEVLGDELKLNFGVFNSGESLDEQLNKADISEMETITFKQDLTAVSGVRFNDVDGTTGEMEVDLNTINLTNLNDTVSVNDANGVTVNGFGGADTLSTGAAATLDGGDGNDTLNGSAGDDTLIGGAGNDAINTNTGNDTVVAGAGDDSITVPADDLSNGDNITGGEGTDTLITSDTNMADVDFTNITEMEVLTLNVATVGNFASEFKESGIRTVNGSAGVDSLNFKDVSNDTDLTLHGNDGDDIIMGGSGDDTITAGEGADTITGSTGADTINLAETVQLADLVVYTRAEDGAQTGQNTGYDVIQQFVASTDKIVIDGSLETALDNDAAGNFLAATTTNEAALDAGIAGLSIYTNTTLQDSDLTQTDFTEVLNLLNTNLQTAAAGDNVLYVVQSTNDTGLYFYQENTGDNVIGLDELKMLSLVDNSLLTAADISDQNVASAGGNVVVVPAGNTINFNANNNAQDLTGDNAVNETFFLDAVSALLDANGTNTQVTGTAFDVANDVLRIDMATAQAGVTTLAQLNGVNGVTVQTNGILQNTLVNFGSDANGGEVVTVTLAGIVDPATVNVEIV